MSSLGADVLFWLLGGVALAGAVVVVTTREVMRLAVGLGAMFLAVAGLFAYFGFGFLAIAEVFLYVGGVLVLFLFAIMLVHRDPDGAPALGSRPSVVAVLAAAGVFGTLVFGLNGLAGQLTDTMPGPTLDALGAVLLGGLLPQFELAGMLLLVALAAIVAVMSGGDR